MEEEREARLQVTLDPGKVIASGRPGWILKLAAQARVDSTEQVSDFFDLGHEWIVRGFADITTPDVHKIWERKR
jgi:hypothetical protein